MPVVEDYIRHYAAHDWEQLARCFDAGDFQRTGPYLDVIADAKEYIEFLARVVPTMGDDYELQVVRIVYSPDERVALAQLVEHLAVDGTMTDIPEAIVFDLTGEGLIRRMCLYLQQPGGVAPVGGKDAMGAQQA
jgi:hypothetical protein